MASSGRISLTTYMRMKTDLVTRRRPASSGAGKTELWRPDESLGYRLKLSLQAWTRYLDAALRPLGLTHLQFIALDTIELYHQRDETPSQARVAAQMQLDAVMISKILRLLEQRGYLRRSPHPDDPRANALRLTQAGRVLVHAASPVVREAHSAFFDGRLDADSKRALAALLDRVLVAGVASWP
jgi:DNA-binding MarR family transcriptional regulator